MTVYILWVRSYLGVLKMSGLSGRWPLPQLLFCFFLPHASFMLVQLSLKKMETTATQARNYITSNLSQSLQAYKCANKTYDAILAQFVVHHSTDSYRTVRVEWLQCHYTCQIFKCRFPVGQLSVNCWYTAGRQTFRGAIFHFYQDLTSSSRRLAVCKFKSQPSNIFNPCTFFFCLVLWSFSLWLVSLKLLTLKDFMITHL